MHTHDDKLEPKMVRRLEVITGTARRRSWTPQEKADIVAESLAPGAVVSHIARRHGATPQQVFGWRREARQRAAEEQEQPLFAPVVIDAPTSGATGAAGASIEIVIGTATVRVPPGANAATLKTVLRILKAD